MPRRLGRFRPGRSFWAPEQWQLVDSAGQIVELSLALALGHQLRIGVPGEPHRPLQRRAWQKNVFLDLRHKPNRLTPCFGSSVLRACKENLMNRRQRSVALSLCLSLAAVAVIQLFAAKGADNATPLKLLRTIPLGGDGRWDYLCVDAEARRLYLPRTTHVQVVDLDKGTVVGDIPKISAKSARGVALVPDRNLGFISAGGDNCVIAFATPTTLKGRARRSRRERTRTRFSTIRSASLQSCR